MEIHDRRELYMQLMTAFQTMQKNMTPRATSLDRRLPYSQRMALFSIAIHGPTNIKRLSEVMYITSSAATQLVNSLVQAGLVQRVEDSKDRRNVVISLSEEGRELMQKLEQESIEMMDDLFRNVRDFELVGFIEIFQKIGT